MRSPYEGLESNRFWRSGVGETHPLTVGDFYRKKFPIAGSDKIATAGSCFAQHVADYLRTNGYCVLDVEPPPAALPVKIAKSFGYNIYSARFGNVYTVRQLLQLARDAQSLLVDPANVWRAKDRFFDAIRPNIEPDGFGTVEEVLELRKRHLAKVKELFDKMDIFIFTLGLTEAWIDKRSGRVFPTAPGTIAGDYDPELHAFKNFGFLEIHDDFVAFYELIRSWNPEIKIILTVSPVPLTATASNNHVLVATTYSKSVLRSVAGALADEYPAIDYFPSYELVASPWSRGFFYEANMRSINSGGVAAVMRVFFDQHRAPGAVQAQTKAEEKNRSRPEKRQPHEQRQARPGGAVKAGPGKSKDVVCEEVLLDAFAP